MRLFQTDEAPQAAIARLLDLRAGEARAALDPARRPPPGATPPAAPLADAVHISPEARAAAAASAFPEPDLPALGSLLRAASSGDPAAFALLRRVLVAHGLPPAAVPPDIPRLRALLAAFEAALPAQVQPAEASAVAAWFLLLPARPSLLPPPALLALLAEQHPAQRRRRNRRTPPRHR